MRAMFRLKKFDAVKLKRFVDALKQDDPEFTAEWRKGGKVTVPGAANKLVVSYQGKTVLSHARKDGAVRLSALPPGSRETLIARIEEYGLYNEPDYALGVGLAVIYFVVGVFSMPALVESRGSGVALVVGALASSLLLGAFLLYRSVQPGSAGISRIPGTILFLSGFAGTFPLSFLLAPLLDQMRHGVLFREVARLRSPLEEAP